MKLAAKLTAFILTAMLLVFGVRGYQSARGQMDLAERRARENALLVGRALRPALVQIWEEEGAPRALEMLAYAADRVRRIQQLDLRFVRLRPGPGPGLQPLARQPQLLGIDADLEKQVSEANDRIQALTAERDQLRKKADDTTALTGELRARLEKLGQNVDKLTSEKGQLAQGLADAKARLDDLRRQKAAAEARAATFRSLVARLHAMIDAGKLKVVIRDGRMLIALPNDVLFDSGKTSIKPDGQAALAQVAHVLATIPDRNFLVAGDTDDVPIHTARFPSNWELSAARAVEVTKYLIDNGMRPQVLAAAGYGEFDPVAPNDSPEHRAQNRRIEIVLQPNLADIPPLDEGNTPAK